MNEAYERVDTSSIKHFSAAPALRERCAYDHERARRRTSAWQGLTLLKTVFLFFRDIKYSFASVLRMAYSLRSNFLGSIKSVLRTRQSWTVSKNVRTEAQ